jgi:hypothetical protein
MEITLGLGKSNVSAQFNDNGPILRFDKSSLYLNKQAIDLLELTDQQSPKVTIVLINNARTVCIANGNTIKRVPKSECKQLFKNGSFMYPDLLQILETHCSVFDKEPLIHLKQIGKKPLLELEL